MAKLQQLMTESWGGSKLLPGWKEAAHKQMTQLSLPAVRVRVVMVQECVEMKATAEVEGYQTRSIC
jgi:hypothetical protein